MNESYKELDQTRIYILSCWYGCSLERSARGDKETTSVMTLAGRVAGKDPSRRSGLGPYYIRQVGNRAQVLETEWQVLERITSYILIGGRHKGGDYEEDT